jgi:hypothetical protein
MMFRSRLVLVALLACSPFIGSAPILQAQRVDTLRMTVRWEVAEGVHSTADSLGKLSGVAMDASGVVYVSDIADARVWVFAPDGKSLRSIGRKVLRARDAPRSRTAHGVVPSVHAGGRTPGLPRGAGIPLRPHEHRLRAPQRERRDRLAALSARLDSITVPWSQVEGVPAAVRARQVPEHYPPFLAAYSAEDGRIWVRRWVANGDARTVFDVFDWSGSGDRCSFRDPVRRTGFDESVPMPVDLALVPAVEVEREPFGEAEVRSPVTRLEHSSSSFRRSLP